MERTGGSWGVDVDDAQQYCSKSVKIEKSELRHLSRNNRYVYVLHSLGRYYIPEVYTYEVCVPLFSPRCFRTSTIFEGPSSVMADLIDRTLIGQRIFFVVGICDRRLTASIYVRTLPSTYHGTWYNTWYLVPGITLCNASTCLTWPSRRGGGGAPILPCTLIRTKRNNLKRKGSHLKHDKLPSKPQFLHSIPLPLRYTLRLLLQLLLYET